MTELGDDFRAMREHNRNKRMREGWISNKYRTEEERDKWVETLHESNRERDAGVVKMLKKIGIKVVNKSESSFQLQLPRGNAMFYSSYKSGDFIYVAQTKQRIDVSFPLDESILDAIKKIDWSYQTNQ